MKKQYQSPLNTRYASKEMSYLFSQEFKFQTWRKLWIALAETEKELGLSITEEQIEQMKAHQYDINYEVAYEILTEVGLKIERAENGQICVNKFNESQIGYYDAILMDIRMPVMDGYDATKAIRKLDRKDKDLPIIAMTADAFSGDIQVCIECGMNAHIAKPIDIADCLRVLGEHL